MASVSPITSNAHSISYQTDLDVRDLISGDGKQQVVEEVDKISSSSEPDHEKVRAIQDALLVNFLQGKIQWCPPSTFPSEGIGRFVYELNLVNSSYDWDCYKNKNISDLISRKQLPRSALELYKKIKRADSSILLFNTPMLFDEAIAFIKEYPEEPQYGRDMDWKKGEISFLFKIYAQKYPALAEQAVTGSDLSEELEVAAREGIKRNNPKSLGYFLDQLFEYTSVKKRDCNAVLSVIRNIIENPDNFSEESIGKKTEICDWLLSCQLDETMWLFSKEDLPGDEPLSPVQSLVQEVLGKWEKINEVDDQGADAPLDLLERGYERSAITLLRLGSLPLCKYSSAFRSVESLGKWVDYLKQEKETLEKELGNVDEDFQKVEITDRLEKLGKNIKELQQLRVERAILENGSDANCA